MLYFRNTLRLFSTSSKCIKHETDKNILELAFHKQADKQMEALIDRFESLEESVSIPNFDVLYSVILANIERSVDIKARGSRYDST